MKMQKSTLPKFEISIFSKCGKLKFPEKYKIGTSKWIWKIQNLHLQIWNSIANLAFEILKSIFKNPKSDSPIPVESCFETSKFEFSDVENPKIYIFVSKFWFSLQIFLRPKTWFCIRSRNVLGNISDKKMIATLKKRPSGIPDEAEEFRQRLQSVNDYVFSQVVSYA